MDYKQKAIISEALKLDFELFTRYFFKQIEGYSFIVNHHHRKLWETLEKVRVGDIKRLVINIPPRYSKSEIAVVYFVAWCLTNDPQNKFMHLSYSDTLAVDLNSSKVKDIITCDAYRELYGDVELRTDSKSKKRWATTQGGGLYATSTGGQVTGLGAGRMDKGKFTGALIIDDPLKPSDAFSETTRNFINNRYNNTFKTRTAHQEVPVIVIMQRLHDDDMTGWLLNGGSGEKWHHLNMPIIQNGEVKSYKYAIPIEYEYKGALWEFKHTIEDIEVLKKSDSYVFQSQFMQSPSKIDGNIFKEKWWKFYTGFIDFQYTKIFADTAIKTGKYNDFSVFQIWGYWDNRAYLIKQYRGKWESPELLIRAKMIVEEARKFPCECRGLYIEDAGPSGQGLIQQMRQASGILIKELKAKKDKLSRAMDAIPYIEQGRVFINSELEQLSDYIIEFSQFTADDSHKHDDMVDASMYAIIELLGQKESVAIW